MAPTQFKFVDGPGAADICRVDVTHASGTILATDASCVGGRNADIGEAVIALMAAIRCTRARRGSMPKEDVVAAIPSLRTSRPAAVLTAASRISGEVPHAGN
ncbi:hypothetical protein LMG27952_04769 [Paraburkholderia hiiakae]|uniref:Uncharacterized protein n=1 Tax=Paraburkholderia hiiakae TaxID=1081782 RepID=A0ABM8NXX5_9BURK|nr:hypothetical protein [Paraburkholderia hiiakae]CAD6548686.1 hypothetical protein LMG27952_04769 [Paraburkholderia hiiakae]